MAIANEIIQSATDLSVQKQPEDMGVTGNFFVGVLANAGNTVPPWWSISRDKRLRTFWKSSDHLSGSIYTMQARMESIPFRIVPKDRSHRNDVEIAERLTEILQITPNFGSGWGQFFGQFVEEFLTQDNGAFVEIIAPGPQDKPIVGLPISIAHLDSARCTRTGNAIFPIIYEDEDGKRYKFHYTRVMFVSQMPSPIAEMYGVGFCGVSRAVNVAQTLMDILIYKQEKLGSRPHRQIIITKGGLDPNDLASAFKMAESNMDSQGLTRYSKVVVGGSSSIPEAGVDVVELSKMPDGFDEQTSITLGMATIALAFGVDARELFPAMSSGATRADALLQHLKQRGKGPGQILQTVEQMVNFKLLPQRFKMVFDFQDDAEDRQVADIRKVRADARVQNMSTNSTTPRVLREQMVSDGEVDQSQFDRMELDSGRLPNGQSVLTLFFTQNSEISRFLDIGVENPLDVRRNSADDVLNAISDKRAEVYEAIANAKNDKELWNATVAQSALNQLEVLYVPPMPFSGSGKFSEGINPLNPTPNYMGVGQNYIDPRVRTEEQTNPTSGDREQQEGRTNAQDQRIPPEDRPESES